MPGHSDAVSRTPEPSRLYGGYLRKRYSSSMYMGSWRFCVLQGARLRWYRSRECAETDTQLRGEVWVQSVEPWDGRGALSKYPHAFAVRTTTKRLLLCSAETEKDRDAWINKIERSLQRSKSTADLLAGVQPANNAEDGTRRIVPGDMRPAPALQTPDASAGPPTPCAFPSPMATERPAAGSDATSIMSAPTHLLYTGNTAQALAVGDAGCAECFRQEFIGFLRKAKRFLTPMVARGISMDALVVRSDATGAVEHYREADLREADVLARTLHKLRHGSMTLNRTIKILYQTRKKPHLFRAACERLPFYTETCIDRVENLWYQLLHLVQCLDAEQMPRCATQLFYLQRYIRAICRRSPRIALQTIWHVQASVGDGSCHNLHPHTLLSLLGFIYPNTTLPESSQMFSVWKDLVFADCPEHQLSQILADLRQINSDMEKLISLEPDSMIERWLNATTVSEFERSAAELASSGIELCEFQSNILYDSLDIERSNLTDGAPDNGIESLVLEQVSFVQSLAAISERLRHIQPVSDRGKYLAGELEALNTSLRSSALYPLSAASDELYQVVRIPPTEGKVFSTKMRAPTLIFVETVPVQTANTVGLGDQADTDRLRPFVCSSQPRNSTFFESAILDEIEASIVSSGGETMLSPSSTSTLATPTPTGGDNLAMSCPDNLTQVTGVSSMPSTREQDSESQSAAPMGPGGILGRLPNNGRNASASVPANNRLHSGIMAHLPQPSRGSKMAGGGRAGRRGVENFVYDSKIFGESWEERKARIQSESPMGKLPGWDLFSVIVKTNDDLRQEVFTMQLIHKLKSIFEFEAPHLWLRTYRIVATGANIGLLETITDACSLDHLKKTFPGGNLKDYFHSVYGDSSSAEFVSAQRRFIESMAAYSIVSYVLLLKDRHNGNILLSAEGRVIHIDFGFILGIAPGGMFSVEDAPFKLTKEMVDVMGGLGSPGYKRFHHCLCEGFSVLQKYQAEIVALLQTTGQHSPFPCFDGAKLARVISDLRRRLCVGLTKRDVRHRVDHLVRKSYNAWGTRQYDSFQLRSNNIHP
ncbi:Phosphatidylinositol 4-kinase beta [Phytophthora boehmeriae]|uniref:1-phosphatidylinositol 4-kinase n=1 Tax=Phytophthora boehmeriae TaxID=109152 RepID=A0A8T1WQR2_9STRA|nr:Phosphatidylinositol 4-kinase beta [Phytophthora boehmeriae]